MVTVVVTQELEAEDLLLQFKAEASQDDIHGSRPISARPAFGNHGILLTCMPCVSSIFFIGSRVCCVFLVLLWSLCTHARARVCVCVWVYDF